MDFTPEVPAKPKNPDDPNDPNNSGNRPEGSSVHLVLDEAAWANREGGAGAGTDHANHGWKHTDGSFDVRFHGGETGDIIVGDGANACKLSIDAAGNVTILTAAVDSAGKPVFETVISEDGSESLQQVFEPAGDGGVTVTHANGVDVTIKGATSAGEGRWTVSFDYELTGAQKHDQVDDYDKKTGADDYLIGDEIKIQVIDQTGDMAEGKITVEVHDDGPKVSIVEQHIATVKYGADTWGSGSEKIKFEVFDGDKVINWGTDDKRMTDISDLAMGQKLTVNLGTAEDVKNVTVERTESGDYKFSTDVDGFSKQLTVKATDSDKDTDVQKVYFSRPTINPKDDPDPKDDPTPDPDGTTIGDYAIVDEGSQTESVTDNDKVDANHQQHGPYNFSVNMNGETGSINIGGENGYTITIGKVAQGQGAGQGEAIGGFLVSVSGSPVTDETTGIEVSLDTSKLAEIITYDSTKQDWTVNYKAAFKPEKGKDHTPKTDNSVTDTAMSGKIDLSVTDESGDTATGVLKLVLHDDTPLLTAVTPGTPVSSGEGNSRSLTGTFDISYGKDSSAENPLFYNGQTLTKGEDKTYHISDDQGELVITDIGNGKYSYEYKPNQENIGKDFSNKSFAIDAYDGDGDKVTVNLGVKQEFKPTIVNEKPTPDSKGDEPANPSGTPGNLVMDESDMANGSGKEVYHAASGKSSFLIDLHNDSGNITVNDLTFEVDKDGNVLSVKKDGVNLEGDYTFSINGVVEITFNANSLSKADDGKLRLEYRYELKENHEHNAEGSSDKSYEDDKWAPDGIQFTATVTDSAGKNASAGVKIEIHDDAPVVTGKEDINFTFTERTKFEASEENPGQQIGNAEFDAVAGADGQKSASYSLDIAEGPANTGLKAFVDGQLVDIMLYKTAEKVITGKAGGNDVFTVTLGENGQVIMNQVSGGPGIYHPKTTEANQINENLALKGIQVNKTVTDKDDDSSTGTVNVVINIEDIKPELSVTQGQSTIEKSNPLMLDFLEGPASQFTPTMDGDGKPVFGSWSEIKIDRRWGLSSEIKFIGTFVGYDMDEEGHVTWFIDRNSAVQQGNITSNGPQFTDNKIVLSSNGLGVGRDSGSPDDGKADPGGKDMGISCKTAFENWAGLEHTEYDKVHAQGISIEADKNQVFYGLDIKLSNFEPESKNRAVIVFYQTPRYSNDDSIVKIVEVDPTSDLIDKDGKIVVDVPDGFTKAHSCPANF